MNKVYLQGKYMDGKFYTRRTSGTVDEIPVEQPIELVDGGFYKCEAILVTKNVSVENKRCKKHMVRILTAQKLAPQEFDGYINELEVDGFLVQRCEVRTTPFGRTIIDFTIAINNESGVSYYPSCIAWGGAAHFVSALRIGTHIKLKGRFQSREYCKMVGDKPETKTAYEICCSGVVAHGKENYYGKE